MAVQLKSIKKLTAGGKANLEASVAVNGGPAPSTLEVASTGPDDSRFTSSQLNPGPASRALNPNESYVLVWTGAFVLKGSTTLRVRVDDAGGNELLKRSLTVQGAKGDIFTRVVLIP